MCCAYDTRPYSQQRTVGPEYARLISYGHEVAKRKQVLTV